jgi:initiation factor 1A
MPNFTGGKKYKSSKHGENTAEFHEIGEGQIVGRVIKNLGNRNLMIYCNDNKERMGHIRGGLRKKEARIEVGDIVLMSMRGDGMRVMGDDADANNRCDILAKYEREVHRILKKTDGVNPKLFSELERMDERGRATACKDGEEDIGFTFEASDSEEEVDIDREGKSNEEIREEIQKARAARDTARAKKRNEERAAKESGAAAQKREDDIDIDAI